MTVMLSMTSCTTGFYEMNTNPNQVTGEQMEVNNYRTGSKIRNLQNLVIPVQEHMYQFNESLSGGPFAGYIASTGTHGLHASRPSTHPTTGANGLSPMSCPRPTPRTGE